MYIHPVERARVRRQLRPTSTPVVEENPIRSLLSSLLNPVVPSTTPKPTATTTSRSSVSSSSTSTLSSSTSSLPKPSQRTTSSTSSPPSFTPPNPTPLDQSTSVVTQTLSSSPSDSDASNSPDQTSPGMSPLIKGIVISASVIFGIVFFALVVRKFFQYRRRQKRVSWADNISPFANETGYEKPLPLAPSPSPVPLPAAAAGPPSRRYGSQDGPMGAGAVANVGYGGRPGYGPNPDQRNSFYNTGTGYAAYPNFPAQPQTMRPYPPYAYNVAGIGAGAAAAAGAGMAYNKNNTSVPLPPPPVMLPNPFAVSPLDTVGPVPISVPVAPPAPPAVAQQILVVTRTFLPNLNDELSIAAGESVMVIAVYDDGWCKVRKLGAPGEEGVVPFECLWDPAQGGLDAAQNDQSRRASSLYEAPRG